MQLRTGTSNLPWHPNRVRLLITFVVVVIGSGGGVFLLSMWCFIVVTWHDSSFSNSYSEQLDMTKAKLQKLDQAYHEGSLHKFAAPQHNKPRLWSCDVRCCFIHPPPWILSNPSVLAMADKLGVCNLYSFLCNNCVATSWLLIMSVRRMNHFWTWRLYTGL